MARMILIADSGSTKTDWTVSSDGRAVVSVHTQGLNPFHMSAGTIRRVLAGELLPRLCEEWQKAGQRAGNVAQAVGFVHFYGAGCTPALSPVVAEALQTAFPKADVEVQGDLLAVARALCQRREGIACILGTGANSCLYDGTKVVANTPPLGYILGDEGSGAVLGKSFLNGIFKGWLPERLRDSYLEWSGMSYDEVIGRVYRQPLANRFLASIVPFVASHVHDPAVGDMVRRGFRDFLRLNVAPYRRQDLSIGFVGGVAWQFRDMLCETVEACGYRMGKVERSPMDGLVAYHCR